MRLGGPLFQAETGDPDAWADACRKLGYSAAYCPVSAEADDTTVRAFEDTARRANIVIAETGAWSNPMSRDEATRQAGLAHCRTQLALADRVGARCCVNISGSRSETHWDGPDPENLTEATFDLIVETVRCIVDDVRPVRTYFTLETMPWMYPDSAESYERLIRAIDRPRFAVHFDPANLLCSPQRYFGNAALITDFFDRLGPWIRSCHAKDILLSPALTTHLDEVRPGLGGMDYGAYLRGLSKLEPDTPLMLEHLPNAEEYGEAADFIRQITVREGLQFR